METTTDIYELLGRYAEDPNVYIEAISAEEAAELAFDMGLAVSPGYFPSGALIPVAVGFEPREWINRDGEPIER